MVASGAYHWPIGLKFNSQLANFFSFNPHAVIWAPQVSAYNLFPVNREIDKKEYDMWANVVGKSSNL
jgi:hypothetical protein